MEMRTICCLGQESKPGPSARSPSLHRLGCLYSDIHLNTVLFCRSCAVAFGSVLALELANCQRNSQTPACLAFVVFGHYKLLELPASSGLVRALSSVGKQCFTTQWDGPRQLSASLREVMQPSLHFKLQVMQPADEARKHDKVGRNLAQMCQDLTCLRQYTTRISKTNFLSLLSTCVST